MKTVVLGEPPAEIQAFLARRRALGQDLCGEARRTSAESLAEVSRGELFELVLAQAVALDRLADENARLVADNEALRDRIARREAEASNDSTTSSKPPSTDPMPPRQSLAIVFRSRTAPS